MKTRYFLIAALALLTLSLNAQTKATKKLVNPKTPVEKIVTPPDGYFRMGPSRASTTPVTPPYSNSFSSSTEWDWWQVINANNDTQTWTHYSSGSNGYAQYHYHSSNAANDWLVTAPITLLAGRTYKFDIDAWVGLERYPEKLEIKLASANTATALSAGTTIIESTTVTATSGSPVTLSNNNITVSTDGDYYIGIHAISDADMYYLYVDNFVIDVEAVPVHDLSVALSAPSQAAAGGNITVTATVTNNGGFAETGYTVNFTAGGTIFDTQTANEPLAAGATATFTAQYPTNAADAGQTVNFGATVTCTDDADATNNSATASTSLIILPPPENVAATANINQASTMTWSAPSTLPMFPGELTWGFEEETDFNAFSTIDSDGDGYNWGWHYNTGSGNFTTHNGNGVTYSESFNNDTQTALTPDNWLISPEITLGGSLSFWACSQSSDYLEPFAVYVCMGSYNSTSDFVKISPDVTTTGQMVQYTYDLSSYQGQGHFAIRHYGVSDMFILNIDDISCQTLLPTQPISYKIYLDGQLVGNVNGDVFSYTFNNLTDAEHTCAVSAVYPGGLESAAVPATIPAPTPVTQGTVSPSAVSFGEVQVGQSATQTVTITNTGNQPFTPVIDATSLPAGVSVSTASQVAAGGNLPLTVTFAPTAEGAVSGTFTVTIPVPDGEDLTFTVTVTGAGYIIISTLTSQTVVVPVHKSDIQAPDRTYVFSRADVEDDIDMNLSYNGDANVKVDVLVKNEEPVVSYDLHRKAGSGNWTYPSGTAVAQALQNASDASTYVVGQETFIIPQDATQLWVPMTDEGVDASSTLYYVPVVVANSTVGNVTGNTYGAPQVQATADPLSFNVTIGGSKSAGRPGGHWTQNVNGTEVDYCVYTPVVSVTNITPAFSENRVPYMMRAWLLENPSVPYYSIKRVDNGDGNTHIEADVELTYPKLLGELFLDPNMFSEQYQIGHDWNGESTDPWSNPWGDVLLQNVFAAPSTLPQNQHLVIAVRAYYYKPQAATSGIMLRDGNEAPGDGYGMGEGQGNGDDIPTSVGSIYSDRTVVDVKYVNALGQQSDRPFDGVNIIVTRYSDGTISSTKVVR